MKMRGRSVGILLMRLGAVGFASTQTGHPDEGVASKPRTFVYKTVSGKELKLHVFVPSAAAQNGPRAAIVFFHGGAWRKGTPRQFYPHCAYLASRGMVAATAEYRLVGTDASSIQECVADAKAAVRWLRRNARRLGIDSHRIVAAGGSAGGHLAACTAFVDGAEDGREEAGISPRPNAMVLFNPALSIPRNERISPMHHVRRLDIPTLIFHGTADRTVPHKSSVAFVQKMRAAGNRCRLVSFEGKPHGFFNYGRDGNRPYVETVVAMDAFLCELGFLSGKATLCWDDVARR